MESSTQQLINIIIDSSIIALSVISMCLSVAIFGFIIYHMIRKRNSQHRVALLLTANIYSALLFSAIIVLIQYIYVLPGHRYLLTSLNDGIYCQIRAYLQWVSLCAVCYSNSLQAIYRLCRVVFYTKPFLQSFQLYQIVIVVQWIICFLIMSSALIVGDFQYSVDDYYCQTQYSNIRAILISGTLAYSIPMTVATDCYICTLRNIRGRDNNLLQTMSQIQQTSARRDLVVLFRICLLLASLMISSLPSIILFIIYSFSRYFPWWSAQIQSLIYSLSTTIVPVVLLLISPHVQSLWTKTAHRQQHHHRHAAVIPAIVQTNGLPTFFVTIQLDIYSTVNKI